MTTTTAPLPRRVPRAAPRRRGARLPVTVAVLAVAGVAAVALTRAGDSDRIAGPAPAFSLDDVRSRGTAVTLPTGRPTVVNFFASWCLPCREELPVLEVASRRAAGAVAFIGIDVNDSRRAATDLLDDTGVTYPTGYDPDRAVAGRYRLQGMPTTVFVGADGRVAEVAAGRLTAADLDRRLARLQGAPGVGTP